MSWGSGTGTIVDTSAESVPTAPLALLRYQLVKDTGHPELVKTSGQDAWADNGANRWLNEGIRWLSMRTAPPVDRMRVLSRVAQGEYSFSVSQCRALERLWLNDPTDGQSHEVCPLSWEELRRRYGQIPGAVTQGVPRYFCRNPRLSYTPAPVLPFENLTAWHHFETLDNFQIRFKLLGAGSFVPFWTLSDDALSLVPTETYGSETSANWGLKCQLLYRFTQQQYRASSLRFKATIPAGISLYAVRDRMTEYDDGKVGITGTSTYLFTYTTSGEEIVLSLPYVEGDQCLFLTVVNAENLTVADTVTVSECEVVVDNPVLEDNFLLMPPADAAYSLEGFGSVYAEELVNDDDENWWTVNHPGMVLRAAQMQYERTAMRNQSGAAEFETSLAQELVSIRHMLALEEMSGPPERSMIGWVRSGQGCRRAVEDEDFSDTVVED